jgi:hypothetical protein
MEEAQHDSAIMHYKTEERASDSRPTSVYSIYNPHIHPPLHREKLLEPACSRYWYGDYSFKKGVKKYNEFGEIV